jgi:tetratricopeptide (TPR) repeat protein
MVIGLNREAEKMYLEALRLQDSSDLEAVAVTQKSLAQTCENLGIFDQAVSRLQEAIRVYELLGDTALVEQLKKREQLLKKY